MVKKYKIKYTDIGLMSNDDLTVVDYKDYEKLKYNYDQEFERGVRNRREARLLRHNVQKLIKEMEDLYASVWCRGERHLSCNLSLLQEWVKKLEGKK